MSPCFSKKSVPVTPPTEEIKILKSKTEDKSSNHSCSHFHVGAEMLCGLHLLVDPYNQSDHAGWASHSTLIWATIAHQPLGYRPTQWYHQNVIKLPRILLVTEKSKMQTSLPIHIFAMVTPWDGYTPSLDWMCCVSERRGPRVESDTNSSDSCAAPTGDG